jgi:MoxR-like ATPase
LAPTLVEASASLREALAGASRGLVEREALVELIALAAVAGEHLLVIGPPGTAKSEAVRRVARALGGQMFEYLLGRFTEPSEIFGPIDLRRLREGVVETQTAGMLPEAEIAFLDEIFLGSTAILNTLLALLNERTFRRGATRVRVPLRVCVGASNALPDDEALAAFGDRFLLRAFLDPIPDPRLEELLEGGWSLGAQATAATHLPVRGTPQSTVGAPPPSPRATIEHLDLLSAAVDAADVAPVRSHLAHAIRVLRRSGITLSDRRAVKGQRLVAAAAVMAGRARPTEADLWPLVVAVPTREGQAAARDALRDVLARSENASLSAAAAEASLGPLARAARIASAGQEALAGRPAGDDPETLEAWRLKLEGVAREIDAGFAQPPEALAAVRTQIKAALGP